MDSEQEIINLIKRARAVQPSDDFTPRVMKAVRESREDIVSRLWNFLSTPREFTLDPIKALRTGFTRDEIWLYFLLVAFAHLVLAIVLFMGLNIMDAGTLVPPVLRLQPWISLLLACWLCAWGYLLKRRTEAVRKGAKFATLIYIEVVVISGVLMLIEFKSVIRPLVPFTALLVGISVAAGIFLAFSCSNDDNGNIKGSSAPV